MNSAGVPKGGSGVIDQKAKQPDPAVSQTAGGTRPLEGESSSHCHLLAIKTGPSSDHCRTRTHCKLDPKSLKDGFFFESYNKMEEQETIRIISKDVIRTLRIPRKEPQKKPIFLSAAKLERITSKPQFLPKEREALKKSHMKEKEEKIKSAEARARQLQEMEASRKQNQALTDLELIAQNRAQHLVERANILKMEEVEEIKRFNQLILGAQCQATRDAQIQEKKQIEVELAEEEERLDTMMEVERQKALEKADKIDELRKEKMIRGKQQIYNQIQAHLENKLIQDYLKEQEKLKIQENQKRVNLEDLKVQEEQRQKQQLLQEEIRRINAQIVQAKGKKAEEEKQADLKILEHQRMIQERQVAYEAEQKRLRKEKELEIARLRAQQEKAQDYKAQQDELRARRHQESTERKWRMKQRELAAKRAHEEAMLKASRLDQIQNKELYLAMEANREKAMLERLLRTQQEAISKEKEQEEKKLQKMLHHAKAIRQQMKEQELSAITKRREMFQEANQLIERDQQRQRCLHKVKEKKLKELRATGISEKYCNLLELKAQKILPPLE